MARRIGDKTEAAYKRGYQFEKRRKFMEAWATWCEPNRGTKVVPFRVG